MNDIKFQKINSQIAQNSFIRRNQVTDQKNKSSFEMLLDSKLSKETSVKFSKHAQERISTRKIELNKDELIKIEKAMEQADDKGVKEALILIGDKAFIANIKSRTIITTATPNQLKDNIFTNIDGAVIL